MSNRKLIVTPFCITLALIATTALGQQPPEPIPGIGPTGPVVQAKTGYIFTEGPAWDGAGNLYFVDIENNRIHKMDSEGNVTALTETSKKSNGLMFRGPNELFACEMEGEIVIWNTETKERKVFVSEFEGNRFNAPNDLVFDLEGNVYFTDPMYNAPMPLPQEKTCVYFASKDGGQIKRLVDDLPNPNGILLSTDAKTLYVLPSGQSDMMAYPIESPGVIGEGRVFATLQAPPGRGGRRGRGGQGAGGADGGTLDTNGNLYITSGSGVQIFNKEGQFLGRISLPEVPANVGFGGPDRKTLYMTARTSLYSAPTEATGFVFGPQGAAAKE